ncbi:MAG: GIN domain-containing protein [Acidimicrobiales bacterium]
MTLFRVTAALVLGWAVSAAGCGSDQCVSGAGPIVSQTIDLTSLTGFDFQVGGEVTAVPGGTQRVVVRAEQNVLDRLNRDVVNGIWEIGFTECVRNVSEFRVDITVPELDGVELSGAGTVNVETEASSIDTILSGAGTVTLTGETTSQQVTLAGSGTVEAFELTTEETSVLLTGQGTVNVTANEQLDVDLLGAGAVFYKGDPQLNVRITGAGTVVDAN